MKGILRIERFTKVRTLGKLCWCGHVERKNENDWMMNVKYYEEGTVPINISKKTEQGLEEVHLRQEP